MDVDNRLQIVIVWINILNFIQSVIDTLDANIRRWWTKPDITEQQRLNFGAFSTIFEGTFFFNYKKFTSVVLMAACDAFLRFTWMNVGDYGSLNDASIFNESDLGKGLENQNINLPPDERLPLTNISVPYFFIGDGGFALKKYFITPFTRLNNLTIDQRIFNYRLSRARRTIESAFGLLVNKWKIFNSPLAWKLQNIDIIICACACLHNFLISCEMQNGGNRRDANNRCEDEGVLNAQDYANQDVEIHEEDLNGIRLRNILKDYFASPLGSVPWQWNKL